LKKVNSSGIQDSEIYFKFAEFLFLIEKYEESLEGYTRAIELKPDEAKYYGSRGCAFFKERYSKKDSSEKDYDFAILDFNKAIELNPDEAEYYSSSGKAYNSKFKFDKAISDFSKAIELEPDKGKYYYDRGDAYNMKAFLCDALGEIKDKAKIEEIVKKHGIKKEDFENPELLYDKAISDFSKAIDLKDRDSLFSSYFNLRWIYKDKEDYDALKKLTENLKEEIHNYLLN